MVPDSMDVQQHYSIPDHSKKAFSAGWWMLFALTKRRPLM
jgi:hypothetical protein